MDINEHLGRRLIELQLATREQVQEAWTEASRRTDTDVCGLLVALGALSPEAAERVRAEVRGAQSGSQSGAQSGVLSGDSSSALTLPRQNFSAQLSGSSAALTIPPQQLSGSSAALTIPPQHLSGSSPALPIPSLTPGSSPGTSPSLPPGHDAFAKTLGPQELAGLESHTVPADTARAAAEAARRALASSQAGSAIARPFSPPSSAGAPADSQDDAMENSLTGEQGELLLTKPQIQRMEMLGEGGMGQVYRVRDTRLGREAALKLLQPGAGDPGAELRFLREARITAQLDHPAIPPVYEIGRTAKGERFLLMRVIEGDTLADRIRAWHGTEAAGRDPRGLRRLLEVLVKVGQAVAYAHSRRILHRDLKPANIMVGQFGEVLVMDWGLARDLGSGESDEALRTQRGSSQVLEGEGLTQVGAVLGTLGYMPPEQAGGEEIDARADVFALGAILTEILTGRPPIAGNSNVNKMVATVQGEIDLPREIDPAVPRELDAIAEAALEAEPEERTPDAETFVDDLQCWLSGDEVKLYDYSASERLVRLAQRRPALFLGAPMLMLLLGTLGFVVWQLSITESKLSETSREVARRKRELSAAEKETADKQARLDRAEKAVLWFTRAREQARVGKHLSEIRRSLDRAIEYRGRDSEALLTAADVLLDSDSGENGHAEAGRALLDELLKSDPDHLGALFRLHGLEVRKSGDELAETGPIRRLERLAGERGETPTDIPSRFALAFARHRESLKGQPAARVREPELTESGQGPARRAALEALAGYDAILAGNTGLALVHRLRGRVLASLDRHEDAVGAFSAALEIEPGSASALRGRAISALETKDGQSAIRDLNAAIELDDRDWIALTHRAWMMVGQDSRGAAEADLDRALKIRPDCAEALAQRAELLKKTPGRIEDALRDYNRLIELEPTDADHYYRRAGIRKSLGDVQGAHDDYGLALKHDPDHRYALYYKAKINRLSGNLRGWLEDLGRQIERKPDKLDLQRTRAELLDKLGETAAAIEACSAVLARGEDAETLALRARLHARLGDTAKARADREAAARLDPKIARKLAKADRERQKREEREARIAELTHELKADPKSSKRLRERAKLLVKNERYEEAHEDLAAALAKSKTDKKALKMRAELYEKQEKYEQALADETRLLELDPKDKKALKRRARLNVKLQRAGPALEDYRELVHLDPKNAEARFEFAEVLSRTGQAQLALNALDEAIRLGPPKAGYHQLRARIRRGFKLRTADEDYRAAIKLKPGDWQVHIEFGECCYTRGDFSSAVQVWSEAIRLHGKNIREQTLYRTKHLMSIARSRMQR